MDDQDISTDLPAVRDEIIQDLAADEKDGGLFRGGPVVELLQKTLENHLKWYIFNCDQKCAAYDKYMSEGKASYEKQIRALEHEVEELSAQVEDSRDLARSEIAEISQHVDEWQDELELERSGLLDEKRDSRLVVDQAMKDKEDLEYDRERVEAAYLAEKSVVEGLKQEIEGLEKQLAEARKEAAHWEEESTMATQKLTSDTATFMNIKLAEGQFESKNADLRKELERVEVELEATKAEREEQAENIMELKDQLKGAQRVLEGREQSSSSFNWSNTATALQMRHWARLQEEREQTRGLRAMMYAMEAARNRATGVVHEFIRVTVERAEKYAKVTGSELKITGYSANNRGQLSVDDRTAFEEDVERFLDACVSGEQANRKEIGELREQVRTGHNWASVSGRITNLLEQLAGDHERYTKLKAANQDLQSDMQNSKSARKLLEDQLADAKALANGERTKHNAHVRRLEDRIDGLVAQLEQSMTEQTDAVGAKREQVQMALDEQIAAVEKAQTDLLEVVEGLRKMPAAEGQPTAETNRMLDRARHEAEMFRELVRELTLARDMLRDLILADEEAQQKARARMRAAAEKAASARPEAGGNRAARGAVGGRGTSRGNARHDVRASSSSTYQLFLAMLRHGSVWGSLLAMYTVMMVVIIAEGRRHAEWRGANTVPRALWMSVKDEPVLCLSPPSLEYVRYAVGLLLSD